MVLNSEICQSIAKKINLNFDKVSSWFQEKQHNQVIPFYASFDIRDSGYKISCIDANVFPAGFNNICEEDQRHAVLLMQKYLQKHYPSIKKIILLAEEHTKNMYYWDNIHTVQSLIQSAGYELAVCIPGKNITSSQKFVSASGRSVDVFLLKEQTGDLIISNNDFSTSYDLPEDIPYNPCLKLGWSFRKKYNFFIEYNKIATEFSQILGVDPWCFRVETRLFSPFHVDSPENIQFLKERASEMLTDLKKKQPASVSDSPYLFLKNNSGTYGLGITTIDQAEDLNHLTYKERKTMKATKGSSGIKELIIQEGIPTILGDEEQNVEPVIYTVGSQLMGGFLRGHNKKGARGNLNSPGSVYKKLCMSDLEMSIDGHTLENVYGWVAKIGVLALIAEIRNHNLDFRQYEI